MARGRPKKTLVKKDPFNRAYFQAKSMLKLNRYTIIGFIIVFFTIGLVYNFFQKKLLNNQNSNLVSQTASSNEVIPALTPAESKDGAKNAMASSEKPTGAAQIKQLPNTQKETFDYAVKQGDNLAKIGKIFCDDNGAWIGIASINNINPPYTLHKGDKITIACE